MNIDDRLKDARLRAEKILQGLQMQAEETVAALGFEIDSILSHHGKNRCPKCAGTGAVERLDSGYMRRFGLREWNGCVNCGGDGNERRGRGYVDKQRSNERGT